MSSQLIFELSKKNRSASAQAPRLKKTEIHIASDYLRQDIPALPEVSELQAVRHFTRLSRKNFSIDTQFYPLGSCTMKYNPRGVHRLAFLDGFANRHPLADTQNSQGFMACAYE